MELSETEFELKRVLEDCLVIVRPSAIANQVDLWTSVDERISATHIGDALRLTQVLLNLLNNAIRATHNGYVAVEVELLGSNERSENLRFCVRDTGVGIPRERVESLLQLFAQLDTKIGSTSDENRLQLAICKKIVDSMGGRMGVANNPDKGASFWFSLTLPAKFMEHRTEQAQTSKSPLRLLVIEPSEIRREGIRKMLQDLGHDADPTADAASAVPLLECNHYDLILLAVQSPGENGVAAIQAIRALADGNRDVPIIGMTADILPGELAACRFAGMSGQLERPFSRTELAATIIRFAVREVDGDSSMSRASQVDRKETLAEMLGPVAVNSFLRQLINNLQDFVSLLADLPMLTAAMRDQAHGLVSFAGMLGLPAVSECCANLHAGISAGLVSLPDLDKTREVCAVALAEISAKLNAEQANDAHRPEHRQVSG